MLNTLKTRKKDEGFTIIEVLIVLAIAGLILLIVFLAVPALQRNSRNTTLKSDAAASGAAVSDFAGANNGAIATTITAGANPGEWSMSGASGSAVSFKTNGSTKVTSLGAGATAKTPVYTTGTATPTVDKIDYSQVAVVFGQDCTPALNTRATAVYYVPEASGNVSGTTKATCVQS